MKKVIIGSIIAGGIIGATIGAVNAISTNIDRTTDALKRQHRQLLDFNRRLVGMFSRAQ